MSPSSSKIARSKGSSSRAAGADAPLRGVFVHRMGENAADERQVAEFWRERRLGVDAIEDPRQRFSKLPDLCLSYNGAPWAFCEVKTIARQSWKVRILHDGQPPEEYMEETSRSVIERLTGDLVTAARQLKAGNPDHALLNFVVLVNRDAEASPGLLANLFSAKRASAGRSLKARYVARLADELQSFRKTVDLCLWVNPIAEQRLNVEACLLLNPNLLSFAEEVTGLRGDKLISFDSAA
ncbi:MAG: hypothetical protein ACLPY1_01555 [Terracidiphilus sp.]